jgi:hypothetical protein
MTQSPFHRELIGWRQQIIYPQITPMTQAARNDEGSFIWASGIDPDRLQPVAINPSQRRINE